MPDNFLDKLGNFFHISYTEYERKRDKYSKLVSKLKSDLQKLINYSNEISEARVGFANDFGMRDCMPDDALSAAIDTTVNIEYNALQSDLETAISDVRDALKSAEYKYQYYYDLAEKENNS